jgi:ribonuclease HI
VVESLPPLWGHNQKEVAVGVVPLRLRVVMAVRVWTDGGSRGNPGVAGIGVYVEIEDEKLPSMLTRVNHASVSIDRYVGIQTNNYAEYAAVITALDYLLDNGLLEAEFFSDSKLIVNQLNGVWAVNNPALSELWNEAAYRISKMKNFRITHIRRSTHPGNVKADALANQAQDRGQGNSVTMSFPRRSDLV